MQQVVEVKRAVAHAVPDARGLWLSAALLLVAGVAELFAAWARWLPCMPASSDDAACADAENHLHDYAIIAAPFEALPATVVAAAIGSGLTGLFWLQQSRAASPRRGGPRRVQVFAGIAGVVSLIVGWQQLVATVTESRWGVLPWRESLIFGLIITLAPLVASIVAALAARGRLRLVWLILAAGTLAAASMVEYVLLIPYSNSYDSPVGVGYLHAVTLVVVAAGFASAALARQRTVAAGRTVSTERT